MVTIDYRVGDATQPSGKGPRIIAHVCNDIGGWGRGFVVALSKRWENPEADYRAWAMEGPPSFELGQIKLVEVESRLWVANMVAQRGVKASKDGPPIRYDALERCLSKLAVVAAERAASIHMPRIGCGLAGGEWSEVERLIGRTLDSADIEVVVYDLP